ncbi:helix-turn-helix transcriptional regulator [Schwartzia succinivorans]|jgi:predicted transcriptional regulator|uniref:WYL domain-containing protein n=1 Tax=Schwartzia succinivorans DSM 10502 TaxID=1123243 RepID=A0A1M4YWJ9_9FIRM|nr:WYL domain-containing protein [Schwartzia succinivorans]SHF09927.1 WYL domain-containing protein [Schwartzia succinivorans DSM 10502]
MFTSRYNRHYNQLREFLRLLSYGCYHKTYITKALSISPAAYDKYLSEIKQILPMERLQEEGYGHRIIHALKGDTYYGFDNYLHQLFESSSIQPQKLSIMLCIFQLLGKASSPLSAPDIYKKIVNASAPLREKESIYAPYAEEKTLRRIIGELVKEGVLTEGKKDNRTKLYSLADNPLQDLTDDEAHTLLYALTWYCTTANFSVPGFFLTEVLRLTYGFNEERSAAQFKNIDLARILEDESVLTILSAIQKKEYISCRLNGRNTTMLPLKIITDYHRRRRYLSGLEKRAGNTSTKYKELRTSRLDKLENILPGKVCRSKKIPSVTDKTVPVTLEIKGDTPTQLLFLLSSVSSRFHKLAVSVDNEISCHCTVNVSDPLSIAPWALSFVGNIKVLHPTVQGRIKEQIKEALTRYEQ